MVALSVTGAVAEGEVVGKRVAGDAWLEAMRGSALLPLALGGEANFSEATGLIAGAPPPTGRACCAASFCFSSGVRVW